MDVGQKIDYSIIRERLEKKEKKKEEDKRKREEKKKEEKERTIEKKEFIKEEKEKKEIKKKEEIKEDPPEEELKIEFKKWKGGYCSLFSNIKDMDYDNLFSIWLFLYPNISVEEVLSQPRTDKELDDYLFYKLIGVEQPLKVSTYPEELEKEEDKKKYYSERVK